MGSDQGTGLARKAPDAAELYRAAQEILSTTLSRLSGEAFFEQAARSLAEIASADMGFVGQVVHGEPMRLRTLGLVLDGEVLPPLEYAVAGTPCEVVLLGETQVFPDDVQQLFPADRDLVEIDARAYGSAPLLDTSGVAIGNVGVIFRRPLEHPERVRALLELFALRVATELERVRGEARFRELFEFAPDAVLMVDEDGRITMANERAETILGYPRGRLVGMSVETLVPDEARASHGERRRSFVEAKQPRVMGGGRPWLEAVRRDGTRVPVDISLSPFDSPGGRMVVVAMRDVSEQLRVAAEREKLQEQLRQAQKMEALGQLAGGIAHDFNNMLSAVFGNLALARAALPEEHAAVGYLDEIQMASRRAADLVRQILTFSRQQGLETRLLRPGEVVHEALRLLRPILPATVDVVTVLDERAPLVAVDMTQAIQVLTNLCTNAWDALEGNPGRIRILLDEVTLESEIPSVDGSALAPGRYARVSVEDEGRGMDAAILGRAFEPFYTTKPAGTSTGLGLSVALGIMQRHGGGIRATSTSGQGTRVELYFPASQVASTPAPIIESKPVAESRLLDVLFVDDEPLMVRAGTRILQSLGHRVSSYTDPAEALAVLEQDADRFDVVITDLCMPHRSGVDVVAAVRRVRPDLPIMVMSGHVDEQTQRRLDALGEPLVLQKPWTPNELEDALRVVLSASTTQRPRV